MWTVTDWPVYLVRCKPGHDFIRKKKNRVGKIIHSLTIRKGMYDHTRVDNAVLTMYAKASWGPHKQRQVGRPDHGTIDSLVDCVSFKFIKILTCEGIDNMQVESRELGGHA